jgi:hypothetical protein
MVARAGKGAVRGHETVAQKVVERIRDERASVSKGFRKGLRVRAGVRTRTGGGRSTPIRS